MGEHSSEIVAEWLDRSDEVTALVAAGALEPTDADTMSKAKAEGGARRPRIAT